MTDEEVTALLDKYKKGLCSPDELTMIESVHIRAYANDEDLPYEHRKAVVWKKLSQQESKQKTLYKRAVWPLYAAAVFFCIFSGVFYRYYKRSIHLLKSPGQSVVYIGPGGNRATLTLPNGQKKLLDTSQVGIVISNGHITYQNGQDVQDATNQMAGESENILQLTTPRGGQYQVILSDGTKVWLNAATTLKYPSKFKASKRTIILDGEAYFQVSKQAAPFIVNCKGQELTVLATSFNISAYQDDGSIETTLVDGAVKVSDAANRVLLLAPGEQSILTSGKASFSKSRVSVTDAIAWKNNLFSFKDEPLGRIMRKLSRWYNIEVVYTKSDSAFVNQSFTGTISKYKQIGDVLHLLSLTEMVHFKVETAAMKQTEGRVYVME